MKRPNSVLVVFLLVAINSVAHGQQLSSFSQVWDVVSKQTSPVVKTEAETELASLYLEGGAPTYQISLGRFISQTQQGFVDHLQAAATRTLSEHQDTYPLIDKLLHSNGICFKGNWKLNSKQLGYTGLFARKTVAPAIVRASTTLSGVLADEKRGFSLAVKLFPAADLTQKVKTANLFTIEVLAGRQMDSIFEAVPSNQPDFGISLDFLMIAHVAKVFSASDSDPTFRPITQLSTVTQNNEAVEDPVSPEGIKFVSKQSPLQIHSDDFRFELLERSKKKLIVYDIYVSDSRPKLSFDEDWTLIGQLELTEATISYGCDRRLHFPHPKISN